MIATMTSGIYCIENLVNHKQYIGQSMNISERKKAHYNNLNRGTHINTYLQNAWNKYGEESFKFEVLTYCEEKYLDQLEIAFINRYNTTNPRYGYNLISGGNARRKYTPQLSKKLSIALKKAYRENPEFRRKNAERLKTMKRPPFTLESKIRMSAKCNPHGLYNVSKHSDDVLKRGFRWIYSYRVDGKTKTINSVNLYDLKQKVLAKELPWVEHTLDAELLVEQEKLNWNPYANYPSSTGYYRVCKEYREKYSRGFIWTYHYFVDGHHHKIAALSIGRLKSKVLSKGLEWAEFDEEKGWVVVKPTTKQSTLECFL